MKRLGLLSMPLLVNVCGGAPALDPAATAGVIAVFPAANSVAAPRDAAVTLTFDAAIDAASVGPDAVRVYGRWSGPVPGTVRVEERGTVLRFIPDRPFAAGEWVTVNVSRDVRPADGAARERGYAWGFFAAAGAGTLSMRRVGERAVRRAGEPLVQSYGAYAGDLNGDGFSDLIVPNERANDARIFLNDRSGDYGPFTAVPMPGASYPSTNEGADFDADGRIDVAIGSGGNDAVTLLFGTGDGRMELRQTLRADNSVRGLCVGDFDGDGWPDIATANRGDAGNVAVFLNDGAGRLGSAAPIETGTDEETACAAADANQDGITDLFIGAFGSREIVVLLGLGDGRFRIGERADAGGTVWMIAAGDVNGDGHVDVVSANNAQDNMGVILGDGRGGVRLDATYPVGDTPLAIDLGDLDGDGDLDAVVSNYSSGDFTLYENAGNAFRNPRTLLASVSGSCAVLHDRDGDGDLDITGIDEVNDVLVLFENR